LRPLTARKSTRGKLDDYVSTGTVRLSQGDVSSIPYEDGLFAKACSVMAIFFWPEPVSGLREIYRVL
jgi:hypothetical protein